MTEALDGLNSWEKLSELRVYSQERRRERYKVCFLWKLSQGLTEGYSVKWQWSDRRGRFAILNTNVRNAPYQVCYEILKMAKFGHFDHF